MDLKSSRCGFTLIEIILVLLLFSIIAAITIPNFSQTYKTLTLKKTADDLAYLMRYAQSRAVTKNRQMVLQFDGEFSKYWLAQSTAQEESQGEKQFERIATQMGRTFFLSDGLKIESEAQAVYFYTDGTMDKERIFVCREQRCFTISTQEQRGEVLVADSKVE